MRKSSTNNERNGKDGIKIPAKKKCVTKRTNDEKGASKRMTQDSQIRKGKVDEQSDKFPAQHFTRQKIGEQSTYEHQLGYFPSRFSNGAMQRSLNDIARDNPIVDENGHFPKKPECL